VGIASLIVHDGTESDKRRQRRYRVQMIEREKDVTYRRMTADFDVTLDAMIGIRRAAAVF